MVVAARKEGVFPSAILRRCARWFLKRLVVLLVGVKVPDLNSGFRIFDKKKSQQYFHLICDGFSFTTTITLVFLSNRYPIKYVPVSCRKRSSGRSKIRPLHDLVGFAIIVLQAVMYFNPLSIFFRLFGFFLALLVVSLGADLFYFHNLSDTTTILLVAAFFFFSIGLLADLINKRGVRL
jgi:hypothetical protein